MIGDSLRLALCTGLALCPLLADSIGAQQDGRPPYNEEWRWADYGTAEGAPPGLPIEMAHDGTVTWILSSRGIAWFDDYLWHPVDGAGAVNFRRIAARDGRVALLLDDALFRVTRAPDGSPAGVERIPGLPDGGYFDMAWDARGTLHVLRNNDELRTTELHRLVDGRLQAVPLPEVIDISVPSFIQAIDGGLLVGTVAGIRMLKDDGSTPLIVSISDSGFEFFPGATENEGLAFLAGPSEERVLLSWADGQLRRLTDEGTNIVLSAVLPDDGFDLVHWDTGTLREWINGRWESIQLPGNRVQGLSIIFEEPSGDQWFVGRNGLHLFRKTDRRWARLEADFPSLDNRVNVLLYEEDGSLLFGTAAGLSIRRPDGTIERTHTLLGRELGTITGIVRDAEGRLLISSGSAFQGLFRQELDGTWEYLAADFGLAVGIHRLYLSPDGSVFGAALQGFPDPPGIYRIGDRGAGRVAPDGRLSSSSVYAIGFTSDGGLWAGGLSGIGRLGADGEWTEWPTGTLGMTGARIFDLAVGPDDQVWFSNGIQSGNPLGRLDPSTGVAAPATPTPHPATDGVWALSFDRAGRLWTTSLAGVGYQSPLGWMVFDYSSGLLGELSWPVLPTEDAVFVGTAAGLQILDLTAARSPPPILTEVRTEYEPGRLEFEWVAHAFRGAVRSSAIETRYRLNATEWSEWSTLRTVGFDDPSRGRYTLDVQARGIFGQTGETLTLSAVVPAPLLLRPWLAIPIVTLLLLLAVATVVAVTRKNERDRAVRESERRLRAYLEQAPEAILLFDMHRRRVVDGNDLAMGLLGLPRDEFIGIGLTAFERREDDEPGEDSLAELVEQVAVDGRVIDARRTLERADGVGVPVALHLTRLPEPESHLIRISLVDRSEQEEAERQRNDMEIQLVQAQKLEAVGQLTGGIAHDFNNLLTVVQGNLEFLRTEAIGDSRRYADQALLAAERGGELVRRLLAFSMRQSLVPRALDPVDALQDLMPLLERTLGGRIQLNMLIDGPVSSILADRSQLDNAILNCCINARDAMTDGGQITIRASTMEVSAEMAVAAEVGEGPYVRISIEDSGEGISPDVLEKVFEPFFTTKEVGKGSGLGLSMVYGFTRQSGGFARVQSELGEGTRVHLYFPCTSHDAPTDGLQGDLAATSLPGAGHGVALLVEDDPHLRGLLEHFLKRHGYEAVSVASPAQAESWLAEGLTPQLVLVDAVLPGGTSGFDWLCDSTLLREVPAVAVSGSSPEIISGFARLGEIPFLQKPFTLRDLEVAIRRARPPSEADPGSD